MSLIGRNPSQGPSFGLWSQPNLSSCSLEWWKLGFPIFPFQSLWFYGLDLKKSPGMTTLPGRQLLWEEGLQILAAGKFLSWTFIWNLLDKLRSLYRWTNRLAYGEILIRWTGGSLQSIQLWQGLLYLLYLRFLFGILILRLIAKMKGWKLRLFTVFTEWSNRRSTSY